MFLFNLFLIWARAFRKCLLLFCTVWCYMFLTSVIENSDQENKKFSQILVNTFFWMFGWLIVMLKILLGLNIYGLLQKSTGDDSIFFWFNFFEFLFYKNRKKRGKVFFEINWRFKSSIFYHTFCTLRAKRVTYKKCGKDSNLLESIFQSKKVVVFVNLIFIVKKILKYAYRAFQ